MNVHTFITSFGTLFSLSRIHLQNVLNAVQGNQCSITLAAEQSALCKTALLQKLELVSLWLVLMGNQYICQQHSKHTSSVRWLLFVCACICMSSKLAEPNLKLKAFLNWFWKQWHE